MATIFLTAACNLKCPYCYATENEFAPTDRWTEQRIQMVLDLLGKKGFRLAIGGGEPLTEPELTFMIGRNAALAGVPVSLLTNGYLLTEQILQELLAAGFGWIQISADSYKELRLLEPMLRKGAEIGLRMAIGTVLLPRRIGEISKMRQLMDDCGVVGWRILRYTPLNDNPYVEKAPGNQQWIELLLELERQIRAVDTRVQIRYEPSIVPLAWWNSLPAPERLDICGGRNARRVFLYPDGEAFSCGLPRRKGISLGGFEPDPEHFAHILDQVPEENCQLPDLSFLTNAYCRDHCKGGCLQMRNGRSCDPRCEIDRGLVPACCFEKLLLAPGSHTDGKIIYPSEVFGSWLTS